VLLQCGNCLALDRLRTLGAFGSELEQIAGFTVRLALLLKELLVLANQCLSTTGAHKMLGMPVPIQGGYSLPIHNLSTMRTLIIVGHFLDFSGFVKFTNNNHNNNNSRTFTK